MGQEFEGRDLSDSLFWGVDLSRTHFRDANLTDASIQGRVVNVDIDGLVEHLTVNGVDVTQYVNEHDSWYPLRGMLRPAEPDGMLAAWHALQEAWETTIERARRLTEPQRNESVGGEWSFVDTLRHLVFAMDKWFTVPILGEETFHSLGLPNTGSADFGWPGLNPGADPSFDEVLRVRAARAMRFAGFLDTIEPADLVRQVEVLENGMAPVNECIYTVFEEEFEHNLYAGRDLAQIDEESAS